MDAIYPGYMPYSALVPEVSAKEFIAAVQAQFGVVFILQSDKTVKMQFTEKILKLFSKTRKLDAKRDKQISFNSAPDYAPSDEMDKIKTPEYLWDTRCESLRDGYCVDNGIDPTTIDDISVGECYSFELDGVCQRTTTTLVGDTDETKTSECPLAFGVCTNMYNSGVSIMEYIYLSILIDYIEVWSRESPEFGEYDQLYVNTTGYGLYREFNTEYHTIAENSDRITITTVLKTAEVNQFDFTIPYVIQGRLCWPAKLQYELENSDKQHVTIEFIAGRKL